MPGGKIHAGNGGAVYHDECAFRKPAFKKEVETDYSRTPFPNLAGISRNTGNCHDRKKADNCWYERYGIVLRIPAHPNDSEAAPGVLQ